LIVDSDVDDRALIAKHARLEGYEATEASDGETAISLCRQSHFDLMILEAAIPGLDGFSTLHTVRTFSQLPVLILSSRCSEADRIRGLELGADDYMAKPFSTKELMLRVAAILKRGPAAEPTTPQLLNSQAISIDLTARRVYVDDVAVSLTPKEFNLLTLMVSHPNVAFSRKQLLDMVWGGELPVDTRTLDTHIKQIRRAISPYSDRIVTLRGVGYRFE
jgi:DNA-binding response OmpR family regulator